MKIKSSLLKVNLSAQKARVVVNLIRGKLINYAIKILSFNFKKSFLIIKKFLFSSIANIKHNFKLNIENFFIYKIYVEKAKTLKRFIAKAKGRNEKILKQSCHIYLILKKKKKYYGSKN